MTVIEKQLHIRYLGLQPYLQIWQKMQTFTEQRNNNTVDEIWLVEHPAVFTQGRAGKAEHLLQQTDIPIVQSDRGGQITYHAPGQLIAYLLINIQWTLTGVESSVRQTNNNIVRLQEKRMKIIGLGRFLKFDFLKYYK
jgi:lipoyl(octanoyl) transferase